MKQLTLLFISVSFKCLTQSFAPAPGEIGSTAIQKDSSIFVDWATGINLNRGYLDIADKTLGFVSYGSPENGLQKAEGNSMDVVSLGDSGIAILTFEHPIFNGDGFDFAVFENAFDDHLMELAFVEVSSDGIHFAKFPATSEIPLTAQLTGFEYSNCAYVNNLAGKYRQGYGTPFDLSEINDQQVNVNHITHIKLIDAIGSVDLNIGSFDNQNRLINDPYPTAFESGGFDLDGVGVIHSKNQTSENQLSQKTQYVINNGDELIVINLNMTSSYRIIDLMGKQIIQGVVNPFEVISILDLKQGIYFFELNQKEKVIFFH